MLTRTLIIRCSTLLLLTSGLAVHAGAQDTVKPMTQLRVSLPAGRVETGRLAALDRDTLTLDAGNARSITLARGDISLIERRANYAGRGAKILGAAGGVVGALGVGGLVAAYCSGSSGCSDDIPVAAFMGGITGAAAGAILGAGIGVLIPRWKPVSTNVRMALAYR